MNCPSCHEENQTGSVFCRHCGTSLEEKAQTVTRVEEERSSEKETAAASAINSSTSPGNAGSLGSGSNQNPASSASKHEEPKENSSSFQKYVSQGKILGQNYFKVFVQQLKAPSKKEMQAYESVSNGLISLLLTALFIPAILYFQFNGIMKGMNFFGFGPSPARVLFFTPLFYLVLFLALMALAIFGVTKLMKSSVSVKDVIGRFGRLLIVPVGILAIAALLSLIKLKLGLTLGYLGMVLILISAILTIFSYRHPEEEGLDPYLAVVLYLLCLGIFGKLFLGEMFGQLLKFV